MLRPREARRFGRQGLPRLGQRQRVAVHGREDPRSLGGKVAHAVRLRRLTSTTRPGSTAPSSPASWISRTCRRGRIKAVRGHAQGRRLHAGRSFTSDYNPLWEPAEPTAPSPARRRTRSMPTRRRETCWRTACIVVAEGANMPTPHRGRHALRRTRGILYGLQARPPTPGGVAASGLEHGAEQPALALEP